jgi:dethiobiotin synthase
LIGGLKNSGKTLLGCAILQIAVRSNQEWGAMKPFDVGLLQRNAKEVESDASYYCQLMAGKPAVSLITPYLANENYPIEMAYERDCIRINWELIKERLAILEKNYDCSLVELPSGLLSPLTEKVLVLDWAESISDQIIWIMTPTMDQLEHNFLELKTLFERKFKVTIVLNNQKMVDDADLLFFIWEKIEKFFSQEVKGMIPYISECEIGSVASSDIINKNLPNILSVSLHDSPDS